MRLPFRANQDGSIGPREDTWLNTPGGRTPEEETKEEEEEEATGGA